MEAKELIIKLIDTNAITGEEALILFEAINKPKEIERIEKIIEKYPWWKYDYTTTGPWKASDYEITCASSNTSSNASSINDKMIK